MKFFVNGKWFSGATSSHFYGILICNVGIFKLNPPNDFKPKIRWMSGRGTLTPANLNFHAIDVNNAILGILIFEIYSRCSFTISSSYVLATKSTDFFVCDRQTTQSSSSVFWSLGFSVSAITSVKYTDGSFIISSVCIIRNFPPEHCGKFFHFECKYVYARGCCACYQQTFPASNTFPLFQSNANNSEPISDKSNVKKKFFL